tara:strand:- start:1483 stop:1602 length:120 start_codon:yes stop_codon:yes gene_type:complete
MSQKKYRIQIKILRKETGNLRKKEENNIFLKLIINKLKW